ncbi:hypothetical protein P4647_17065 [Peribacillus frigoritolerans]|uniref:hypothetical protein n=1 Tax=Peribacillus frigoritolerans TaxID=450367 RepID=UPI002E1BC796|nr:hypothetical protein [Peribacillus frigoritolerans]
MMKKKNEKKLKHFWVLQLFSGQVSSTRAPKAIDQKYYASLESDFIEKRPSNGRSFNMFPQLSYFR